MTENEIKEGFALLKLEHLVNVEYNGAEEYAKKFKIASALKDVDICIGNSTLICKR